MTAEEKLLRAIFGEKAGDVRDASLTCPPGIDGTVVDVKVFTRKGQDKDDRSLSIESAEEEKLRKNLADEIRILEEERNKRIYELLEGRKLESDLIFRARTVAVKGAKLTREMLEGMDIGALKRIEVSGARDVADRDQGSRTAHRTPDRHSRTPLSGEDRQAQEG